MDVKRNLLNSASGDAHIHGPFTGRGDSGGFLISVKISP